MMKRILVAAVLLAGAGTLGAQMPGTAAKQAARNAANAANAQLAQQTGQEVPKQAGPTPAAPVQSARQAPGSKPVATQQAPASKPVATQQAPASKPVATQSAPASKSAVAQAGPAAEQQGAPAPSAPADSASTAVRPGDPVLVYRESYEYSRDGRRDPFVSLMKTTDLRPTLSDLRLTSVLYDQSGRRPIAIMRDSLAGVQWRVTTGMTLGRMRVAAIRPKVVVFTIEEFGFSRQDSLVLGDTTLVRSK